MNLSALPESCIADILSRSSPKDACRLSLVGSTFHFAARSDAVWERFLPPDYLQILSRASERADLLRSFAFKKELYFDLCDHPLLIDGGMKSFSLEKGSGKKCYMLASRDLKIQWSNVSRYWQWVSLPQSRFSEVAELLDVCWLEIVGEIKTSILSPDTKYAAYLVFTTNSSAFGLDFRPAEASISINGQEEGPRRSVFLDPDEVYSIYNHQQGEEMEDEGDNLEAYEMEDEGDHQQAEEMEEEEDNRPRDSNIQYPKQRGDGWIEVELGEFYVGRGQDGDLEVRLEEVKGGNWKRGLLVEGIEIRPKEA